MSRTRLPAIFQITKRSNCSKECSISLENGAPRASTRNWNGYDGESNKKPPIIRKVEK